MRSKMYSTTPIKANFASHIQLSTISFFWLYMYYITTTSNLTESILNKLSARIGGSALTRTLRHYDASDHKTYFVEIQTRQEICFFTATFDMTAFYLTAEKLKWWNFLTWTNAVINISKVKKNLAHNKFDSLNRTSNQPINSSIFIEKVQTTR